jgi:hypothetical protein
MKSGYPGERFDVRFVAFNDLFYSGCIIWMGWTLWKHLFLQTRLWGFRVYYSTAAMYAHGTDYSFKVITFEPEHIKVVWYLVGGRVSDASFLSRPWSIHNLLCSMFDKGGPIFCIVTLCSVLNVIL